MSSGERKPLSVQAQVELAERLKAERPGTAARHRLDLAKNAHELALEKIGAMLKEPEAKP